MTRLTTLMAVAATAWTALASGSPGAVTKAPCAMPRASGPGADAPRVQIALLLDTSNSMDGLIDQARSQLWSVVNEFAAARRAGQAVELQVALYEYGNNRIPAARGYVRQVLPFTTDLDRVSEELFALTTFGGEEYCGLVIQTALDELRWSTSPGDLKAVFIAGNEPFSQGPVDFRRVSARARTRDVTINTIHCGSRADGERTGWSEGARLADGAFGVLDQNQPVAHIPAPQDDEIARLSGALNDTYIPYGAQGTAGQARQQAQDSNAAKANKGAAINRAFTKATRLYSNEGWDLVDAVKNRQVELKAMKTTDLPSSLQGLTLDERRAVVEAKAQERARLQARIQELDAERKAHLAQIRRAEVVPETLDAVMMQGLRDQAACRGFALQ
jgi:von Willebrand factor type A domain-containing protein